MKSRDFDQAAWLSLVMPIVTGALVLTGWLWARALISPQRKFLLPAPSDILQAFADNAAALTRGAYNTLLGAFLGLLMAVTLSVVLAILLSLSRWIRASLYPYLMMLQMTPVIVISPILILWVGPGLPSVVTITFLICFFPLVVNTTQGLVSTDSNLVDLFRMYRASRLQELALLRIPAALPYFFTGLRIAATLGPIGAIVGDFTAGNSGGDGGGLGFLALIYSAQFKLPALYATALTGCALGFAFVSLVVLLQWWSLHRWHDSYRTKDS